MSEIATTPRCWHPIRRALAFLTNGRVVHLRDHDGEITARIAWHAGFGLLTTRRFPVLAYTRCQLLPGGKVRGPSYVVEWEFA